MPSQALPPDHKFHALDFPDHLFLPFLYNFTTYVCAFPPAVIQEVLPPLFYINVFCNCLGLVWGFGQVSGRKQVT